MAMDRRDPADERVDVVPTTATRAQWDAFAQECGSSFWSARRGHRMWQWKFHARYRTRLLDILVTRGGERYKVGQCAVGIGRRFRVFSDGIQLRRGYETVWQAAMAGVLAELGPGRYVYGSFWSTEPPREAGLAGLHCVETVMSRPLAVEVVELGRWPCWEAYAKAVSKNIIRNIRKASAHTPGLAHSVRNGVRSLGHIPLLLPLRASMYARKSVWFSGTRAFGNYVLRLVSLRRYVATHVAWSGRTPVAAISTVSFGGNLYYTDGGSSRALPGGGWTLVMRVLEDHWRATPTGRFMLGYSDLVADFPEGQWVSPVRYRQDCRVSAIRTSIVVFDYRLAGSAPRPIPNLLFERTVPAFEGIEEQPGKVQSYGHRGRDRQPVADCGCELDGADENKRSEQPAEAEAG